MQQGSYLRATRDDSKVSAVHTMEEEHGHRALPTQHSCNICPSFARHTIAICLSSASELLLSAGRRIHAVELRAGVPPPAASRAIVLALPAREAFDQTTAVRRGADERVGCLSHAVESTLASGICDLRTAAW